MEMAEVEGSGYHPTLPRNRPRSTNGMHNSGEQDESERTEDEEGRKRTEKDKEGRKEEDAEKRADKLRALIRQGESISDDILDLIKEIDEKEEKLNTARAVLNAKDLEDGKNLLLYAAAHGQVDSLTCLVRNMSERNNALFRVLVKGLRASDVDGAPLLFHAAKSGNIRCLEAVEKFIKETLGPHELAEQLLTRDHISSTIIMYAAKSRNLEMFSRVQSLLNRKEYKNFSYDFLAYDNKGRSLLHIAARSGEVNILEKVVGIYSERAKLPDAFSHPDKRGRTPLMYLLRNRSNAGFDTLQKMCRTLDEAGGGNGAALNQLKRTWRTSAGEEAPTGLMHAARGGINSLRLVLNILCPGTPEHEKSVHLNDILGDSSTKKGMELIKQRRGVLLAEAAGGGSVKVLESVVSAIKTNVLKIKGGNEPTTGTERVREAMGAIQSYRDGARPAQNVFKYAISSGNPKAVEYIRNRVIECFSQDKDKLWKLISGTDGGINCLTYAASVEDDQNKAYDESRRGDGGNNIEPTAEIQEESGLGNGESKSSEEEFHEEERIVKHGGDNIEPTAEIQEESGLGNGESKSSEEEFHEEERIVKHGGDNIEPTAEIQEESGLGNGESKSSEEEFHEEERIVKHGGDNIEPTAEIQEESGLGNGERKSSKGEFHEEKRMVKHGGDNIEPTAEIQEELGLGNGESKSSEEEFHEEERMVKHGGDNIEPTAEIQEESGLGNGESKSSEEEFHEERRIVKHNAELFDEVLKAVDEAAAQFGKEKRVELLESLFIATPKENKLRGGCKGCIRTPNRNSRGYEGLDGAFGGAGDSDGNVNTLMPLAGAVFRSNAGMVEHVYQAYRRLSQEKKIKTPGLNGWDVQKIMDQIPDSWTNPKEEDRIMYEVASSGGVPNVAPSMLGTIVEVLRWAHRDAFKIIVDEENKSKRTLQEERLKERRGMRLWMERLIQVAAERGAFHAIRDLTRRTSFPFRSVMPPLLERIGDNEENTIEIVLHAISTARNPFHLGAVALRFIRMAQIDYPMHEHSLSRLQGRIDRLMIEILRKLPKTVRSMGLEFGAHISKLHSKPFPKEEWERLREADELGFAVVQWMLEPSTVQDKVKDNHGSHDPEDSTTFLEQDPHRIDDPLQGDNAEDSTTFQEPEPDRIDDPLQSALDRGSDALSFTNSPLVRDYMHSKFSKSVPSWVSRVPFHHNIHEKFFKYGAEDKVNVSGKKDPKSEDPKQGGEHAPAETAPAAQSVAQLGTSRETVESLQINGARKVETAATQPEEVRGTTQAGSVVQAETGTKRHRLSNGLLRFFQGWDDDINRGPGILHPVSGIPHRTPMPALQFALAGIVGKPATFYEVPIVRFAFGIISHTAMLALFCSCVFLKSEDRIPPNEIIFHVIIFGLLWRELLEIRELLPPRDQATIDTNSPCTIFQFAGMSCTGLTFKGRRTLPPNRVASALKRYLFYDSWNILDASTIICALIAMIFRMAARFPGGVTNVLDSLHLSYPSNIRETTFFAAQWFFVVSAPLLFARLLFLSQVDQTLGPMSQIIWTMLSHLVRFSLFVMVIMFSFAIAFYVYFFDCYEGDDDVQEAYGTLERSMLTLFNAMLGDFDFDVLLDANDTCERPSWANAASACLLVLYLVIMAILLLNLLIAVLSTAHAEVERNAKEEFHLARSRAIQQNWKIVLEDRLPSPMNLVKPILGTVVDFFYDLLWVLQWIYGFSCKPFRKVDEGKQLEYEPFSKGYWWNTAILGSLHRLVFACSMGLVALAASALLWILSIPWMAWRYYRWCFQRRQENAWYREGYFSSMISMLLKVSFWLIFVFLAIIICAFSILGLILLWFRGVKQVFEWCENHCAIAKASGKKHKPPERDWTYAWGVARDLNLGPTFDVGRLLRVTTGWEMKDISAISKKVEAGRDEDLERVHHADVLGLLEQLTGIAKEVRDRVKAPQVAEKKDEGTHVDLLKASASGADTGESA